MKLLVRLVINAVAIGFAAWTLSDFTFTGDIINLLVVAIIFGLVNALIRPIVKLLALPINILTLGLFTLVINALMLMITAAFSSNLQLEGGFFQSFVTAFFAALLISVVSTVLSWILPDN